MVGEVRIQYVSKTFTRGEAEEVHALQDVSLNIHGGEFVSLIGASGCGKSTLLRLIAGLITPDSGAVFMDDTAVTKPTQDCGFAFQQHNLFPWLTIEQNIAFGLKNQKKYDKQEVARWVDTVGLSGFERLYPHESSGGMCQRAALARALIVKPKVLLLDEPLGALDAFTRMTLQDEILKLREEHNITMIMVTHDVDEAVYMSNRVVVLTPRPGRIEQIYDIRLPYPRARASENFAYYRAKILETLHFGGKETASEYAI